jgi:hypothetical protein
MMLISLTESCRLLAIDAKTLHRWLSQAQLPLQPHPGDGREKGITADQLHWLATAHHRSLPSLLAEQPSPAPAQPAPELSPLPADLLDLLQHLQGVPAQLAALQQQLAALTARLDPPPATASQAPPCARDKGRSLPATVAVSSRPCAPRARPVAHVIPRVESASAGRYVVICPTRGLLPFEPDSPQWFAWLDIVSSFRFVGKEGRFTAHHECLRVPRGAWRAHRQIRNHSYTLRLAPSHDLTSAVLEQAAAALQAHLV